MSNMFWANKKDSKKQPEKTLQQAYKEHISALETLVNAQKNQIDALNNLVVALKEGNTLREQLINGLKQSIETYRDLVERGIKLNEEQLVIITLKDETIADLKEQLKNK